jgi:hypothetical protein
LNPKISFRVRVRVNVGAGVEVIGKGCPDGGIEMLEREE